MSYAPETHTHTHTHTHIDISYARGTLAFLVALESFQLALQVAFATLSASDELAMSAIFHAFNNRSVAVGDIFLSWPAIHSLIHSFIHSLIHSFIQSVSQSYIFTL